MLEEAPATWEKALLACESMRSGSFRGFQGLKAALFTAPLGMKERYTQANCDWHGFIQVQGLQYRADPRLQLLDASQASHCVAVPRSPLTATCEISVGCAVANGRGTQLVLNSSTLELIFTHTGRYVYSAAGFSRCRRGSVGGSLASLRR